MQKMNAGDFMTLLEAEKSNGIVSFEEKVDVEGAVNITPWRGPDSYRIVIRNVVFKNQVYFSGFTERRKGEISLQGSLFQEQLSIRSGEHVSVKISDCSVQSLELEALFVHMHGVMIDRGFVVIGCKEKNSSVELIKVGCRNMALVPGNLPTYVTTDDPVLARQFELARVPVFVTTATAAKMVAPV